MTSEIINGNGQQEKEAQAENARPVPEQSGSFSFGQPITHTGFFVNLRDQLLPKVRPLFDRMQKLCSWSWNPEGSSLGEPAKSTVDQLRNFRDDEGAERLAEKSEIEPRPATETALSVESTRKEGEKVDEEEQSRRRRALGYRTPREILRCIKRCEVEDDELERKERRERERQSARQAGNPVAHAAKPVPEQLSSFSCQQPLSDTGFFVNLREKLQPEVRPLFDRMQQRRSWNLHPEEPSLSGPAKRIVEQLKKFRDDNRAEYLARKRSQLRPVRETALVVDSTEKEEVDEEEQIGGKRAQGYLTPREILRRINRIGEDEDELDRKEEREIKRRGARQAEDPVAKAVRSALERSSKSSPMVRSRRAFHRGSFGVQKRIGMDNRRPVTSFRPQRPVSTSCTGYYVNLRDQQVQPQKRRSWSLHPDAPALSAPAQRVLDQLIQFRADNLAERPTRKRPVTPMPLPPSVVKRIRLSGQFQENESKRRRGQ